MELQTAIERATSKGPLLVAARARSQRLRDAGVQREPQRLQVQRLKVVFEQTGRSQRVEWRCSESLGTDCCPPDERCLREENLLCVGIQDRDAVITNVTLDGLSLVDAGGGGVRRLDPFLITDVVNADGGFATTQSSVLSYRTDDEASVGSHVARVSASLRPASGFELFFLYRDSAGHPGRVSVFAEVEPVVSRISVDRRWIHEAS
ncbi:MAG: hypothetical protein AAF500_14835 [Myxococcota bacterium]